MSTNEYGSGRTRWTCSRLLTGIVAASLTASSGCGSLTNPRTPADAADGYKFCSEISASARVRASRTAVYGWTAALIGAAAVTIGTLYPLVKGDDLDFTRKIASGSVVAGGGFLVILGQAVLKRSDAASKLEGETASVLGERVDNNGTKGPLEGVEAGQKCLVALGTWASSRSDATAMASQLLDKQKAETKAAEEKKAAADNSAAKANADAAASKKKLKEVEQELLQCPQMKCDEAKIKELQLKLVE